MLHPLKREKNTFGCDRIFADAFRLLMTENKGQIPSAHDEALVLYCNLVAAMFRKNFTKIKSCLNRKVVDQAKTFPTEQ